MNNGDECATGFDGPEYSADGLTKREAFAMASMQGMLSHGWDGSFDLMAQSAVESANALLKALEES